MAAPSPAVAKERPTPVKATRIVRPPLTASLDAQLAQATADRIAAKNQKISLEARLKQLQAQLAAADAKGVILRANLARDQAKVIAVHKQEIADLKSQLATALTATRPNRAEIKRLKDAIARNEAIARQYDEALRRSERC